MNLVHTPNANRLHIALFGKRNSGKSSLINALTGQGDRSCFRYSRNNDRSRTESNGNSRYRSLSVH